METSDVNFDEICRTCMDGGRLLPIFGEVVHEGGAEVIGNDYSASVREYAAVQISKEDGLPQSMCYGCLHLLKSAVYFRKISQRSHQRLAELVSGPAEGTEAGTEVGVEVDLSHISYPNFSRPTSDTTESTSSSNDSDTETLHYRSKLSQKISSDYSEKVEFIPQPSGQNRSEQLNDSENSHSHLSENDMASETTGSLNRTRKSEKRGKALRELVLAKARRRRRRENKEVELVMISEKANGEVGRRKKVGGRKKRKSEVGDPAETGRGDGKPTVEDSGGSGVRSIFKLVSSSERTVRCSLCNVVLKRASMHNHAQKHLGYKFICELCGKGFVSKFGLEQHYMTRHGKLKSLACEQCDYRTGSRFELSVHARSHSGERPFTCDVCGKGFHRRRCMINHVALHSDYRPYECVECNKRFVCSSTLATHRAAAHAPRSRHACAACGAAYARPAALRRHVLARHAAPDV